MVYISKAGYPAPLKIRLPEKGNNDPEQKIRPPIFGMQVFLVLVPRVKAIPSFPLNPVFSQIFYIISN